MVNLNSPSGKTKICLENTLDPSDRYQVILSYENINLKNSSNYIFYYIHAPWKYNFIAYPIKIMSFFFHLSDLGQSRDLLWLTECGESVFWCSHTNMPSASHGWASRLLCRVAITWYWSTLILVCQVSVWTSFPGGFSLHFPDDSLNRSSFHIFIDHLCFLVWKCF